MKVAVIPIVIGALGTISKALVKGLEDLEIGGQVETIYIIVLLKSTRIQRKNSWRLEETCCPLNFTERPSANAGVKISQRNKLMIIIIN